MLLLSGTEAVLVQYAVSTFNTCSADVDRMLCWQHATQQRFRCQSFLTVSLEGSLELAQPVMHGREGPFRVNALLHRKHHLMWQKSRVKQS